MKKALILFVSFFILSAANSQKLPAKKKILATLQLTNKYFMEKWPDAGKPFSPILKDQVISGQELFTMKV